MFQKKKLRIAAYATFSLKDSHISMSDAFYTEYYGGPAQKVLTLRHFFTEKKEVYYHSVRIFTTN